MCLKYWWSFASYHVASKSGMIGQHQPMTTKMLPCTASPQEVFTRATAYEYSWADPVVASLQDSEHSGDVAVEAGVNDGKLDALLLPSAGCTSLQGEEQHQRSTAQGPEDRGGAAHFGGDSPIVQLSQQELRQQVQTRPLVKAGNFGYSSIVAAHRA
jgi:hypothetical protein